MGKRDNSKREKNELNSLLAQLKRSYSATPEKEEEPDDYSIDTSAISEDEVLFNSMIEKMLASNKDTEENKSENSSSAAPLLEDGDLESLLSPEEDNQTEEADGADRSDGGTDTYGDTDAPILSEESEGVAVAVLTEDSPAAEDSDAISLQAEDNAEADRDELLSEDIGTEDAGLTDTDGDETEVDDVLRLMFSQKGDETDASPEIPDTDANEDVADAPQVPTEDSLTEQTADEGIIEDIAEETPEEDTGDGFENADADDIFDDTDDLFDGDEDTSCKAVFSDIDELTDLEDAIVDPDLDTTGDLSDSDEDFAVEDEQYDTSDDDTSTVQYYTPRLILSPEEYVSDALQDNLPSFSSPVESSTVEHVKSKVQISPTAEHSTDKNAESNAPTDNTDISLLIKFGYETEAKQEVGEEKVNNARLEAKDNYSPDRFSLPYGYCGKEFTDRTQIDSIKSKYKFDRIALIAGLIITGVLSLCILALNTVAYIGEHVYLYPVLLALEFMCVSLSALLLWKRLVKGVLDAIHFESNTYSTLSLLYAEYLIFDIVMLVIYYSGDAAAKSSVTMIGFSISLYMIAVSVNEFFTCKRQENNFSAISSSNGFYAAERISEAADQPQSEGEVQISYKIRKASTVNNYFERSSAKYDRDFNLILSLGIVPIISLLIGSACALIGDSITGGIVAMMITAILCTPVSGLFAPALTEFIFSLKLKAVDTAVPSPSAVSDLASARSIHFADVDAIEIVSCTEIVPNKSESTKELVALAHSVFSALGGPLGQTLSHSKASDIDFDQKDLVINSLSDNGIDIYFNASVNVLIGDRQYMQSHNIKVKTDTNLLAATKGYDRSVIYMAFDGIPKLGFIISSKIRPEFTEAVRLLSDLDVRVILSSYEPQINDSYFEQNKSEGAEFSLSVEKPREFSRIASIKSCSADVVCSSDPLKAVEAIKHSRTLLSARAANRRMHVLTSIAGLILSVACAALICLGLLEMKTVSVIVLNLIMILSTVPFAISLRQYYCKDKTKRKKQGKKHE